MDSGFQLGPYQIQDKLGAGGMGEVYRAHDPRLHRDVAIKRLPEERAADPSRRRNLLREARSAARISHQNVATLHDVIDEDGQLYLIMELVEGKTLRERLGRAITLDTALDIAIQCAEGIAAAHRQGVVHRDIKPDNIMITADGTVKVLDFGVATLPEALSADTATETTLHPNSGSSPAGTVPFMAPEVLLGEHSDGRADVFSLGVTLYAMLTGAHPFSAPTGAGTVDRILHHDPEPPVEMNPHVSAELEAVVVRMLAKKPEDRQPDMTEVVADLRRARQHLTSPSVPLDSLPTSVGVPTAPPPRGRAWQRIGLLPALGILALVAVALWAWRPEPGTDADEAAARFDATEWIIAVLPAAVQEDDPALQALSQGLAATLTGQLTQMSRAHNLQVIPTSALVERDVGTYAAARGEFGVTLAIDFQLRRSADRLRVNVNLIDTSADRQLDAASVDGLVADPIDLEEQVALRALRMLRIELLPMERDLIRAGTEEPRAHDFFLRAKGYLQEYSDPQSVDAAITLLEQALQADPDYARAHAALGEAYGYRYQLTGEALWLSRAETQCEAAVGLAETESSGHRCLGEVLTRRGQLDAAAESLEQAKRLDPTDDATYRALGNVYQQQGETTLAEATYQEAISLRPHYWAGYSWLGYFYLLGGRIEEAIHNFEQVVLLAPDSYRGYSNLGGAYYFADDLPQARRAFERALELNPDDAPSINNLSTLYFYTGEYERAARLFERARDLEPGSYERWGGLGDAYYWAPGERHRAESAYRKAIELVEERLLVNPRDAYAASRGALFRAMLGEREPALDLLEIALAEAEANNELLYAAAQVYELLEERSLALEHLERAVESGYPLEEIAADPILRQLREDEAYGEIVRR